MARARTSATASSGGSDNGAVGGLFGDDAVIDGLDIIDPAGAAGPGGTAADILDRRTREYRASNPRTKSGAGAGAGAQKVPSKSISAADVLPYVLMAHGLLSKLDPCFAIDLQEATTLAEAWAGYLKHTSVSEIVDPRTRALFVLCTVMATIEGPRLLRAMAHKKAERAASRTHDDMARAADGRIVQTGLRGV